MRNLGQSICLLAITAGVSAATVACGSSSSDDSTSLFDAGASADATGGRNGSSGGGSGGSGGQDGSISSSDAPIGTVIIPDAASGCMPKSCTDLGFTCGQNNDGCGNVIDCGSCPVASDYCGGGGYSKCGSGATTGGGADGGGDSGATTSTCTPVTCLALGYTCGQSGDGCGGILDCGSTCPSGQYCGGGGFSRCGGGVTVDGGQVCTPKTCADLNYGCGSAGDGCGGSLDCGTCPSPQFCGGGGFNNCGGGGVTADGGQVCAPKTCANLGYTCGSAGDGCGGSLDCGTCTSPQFCGGGGFNTCGGGGVTADGGQVCTPKTCAGLGYNCGTAGDGCGGSLSCGTCTSPQYCGGGGFDTCGGSTAAADGGAVACTPKTCNELGFNCGPAGDGCGGSLDCGTCTGTNICGGSGNPGVCGNTTVCNNLCSMQTACDGGTQTSVTGIVRAGISAWTQLTPDPVPNVLVYVPNAPLDAFTPGASCRQCGADVSGSPLVSTYTDFDGTFTLTNVPAGTNIPIVIQLGRWRRQFRVTVPACASTTLPTLNMPRNQSEGDLPLTAISTGSVDALECVLLKMGVDQSEFTADTGAGGTGRMQIYAGDPGANGGNPHNGAPGATIASARNEPTLMGAGGTYMNYDQIMFPCWGAAATKTATELANLVTYSDSGGHFFATHYSYSWLVNNAEFNTVANWNPNFDNPGTVNWTLGASTAVPPSPPAPHTETFAKWLNHIGALSNSAATVPSSPQVSISNPRHDADSVANGSVDWIDGTDQRANGGGFTGNGTALVEHFTFNTPVGQASQCGHDIFSDFHVTNASNTNGMTFPAECDTAFAPQEKILEFMIWDLASCVPPPASPTCTPVSCAHQNIGCGPAGNGCGASLDCGTCPAGQQCGGGGVFGQCIAIPDGGSCQAQTCAQQNITCGPAGDGCGASLDCGTCVAPQTCGGGGVAGRCGGTGCTPLTCAQQNVTCGPAGDGCGNSLDCGTCVAPQTCGGGGVGGQCGGSGCTPFTCAQQSIACGPAGDGCGNSLDCGACIAPQTCGGGGVAGQCGGSGCTPLTCAQQNINCGPAGDGCGNLLQCGTCATGDQCGGGGMPGQCGGSSCSPLTCAQLNINCGPAGDGCGNLLECGTCGSPATCGGSGVPGQCGGVAM